jgi:hypothetical protein
MAQPSPIYIVTSPRPRVGKTVLARLLMEYFLDQGRPLVGFDINPRDPTFAGRFPRLVWPIDITTTRGQMELFDRLIADTASTKVIDLGYGPFEQFFAVMQEIGFAAEARRYRIEPVVLFLTDPAVATVHAYAELLRQRVATLVPVHNEAASLMFSKEDFPPTRPECGAIRIPRLSPMIRGVIDRPNFSFGAHLDRRSSGPTEVHSWVAGIFSSFRDLELRLLMGRLSSSLSGTAALRRPAVQAR